MTPQETTATSILSYLVQRGHFVDFIPNSGVVSILPTPEKKIVDRIVANEETLTAFLRDLGGRPPTSHAFVALAGASSASVQRYGVCISCGVGWRAHGTPPIKSWVFVADPAMARLIAAAPLPFEDVEAA